MTAGRCGGSEPATGNGPALEEALRTATTPDGWDWFVAARAEVVADPRSIRVRFPAAGRSVGRGVLEPAPPGGPLFRWTADDAARAGLLDALGAASAEIEGLYRHGDTAERRAVLRWIGLLPDGHPLAAPATELVEDALRANDPRLVAAALGPWAIRNLEAPVLRPAVLKCVSLGIPLSGLAELGQRGGPELARVLAGHAHEQIAAGRAVPDDIWPLVHRHPPADVLAAIEAELEHPVAARRRAARSALDASSAAVAQSRRC